MNAAENSVDITSVPKNYLEISVRERGLLEPALDQAVAEVRSSQAGADRGVVVTRHSSADFTVALSSEVPYGMTMEVDVS